jgi:hypothetical protein
MIPSCHSARSVDEQRSAGVASPLNVTDLSNCWAEAVGLL